MSKRFYNNPIGELRHKVTIEQKASTPDGVGGFTENWSTFATPWASIESVKGQKRWYGDQLNSVITHQILIRYRAGVDTSMRINFEGRTFQIHAVLDPEEKKRWLRLDCAEGTGS